MKRNEYMEKLKALRETDAYKKWNADQEEHIARLRSVGAIDPGEESGDEELLED